MIETVLPDALTSDEADRVDDCSVHVVVWLRVLIEVPVTVVEGRIVSDRWVGEAEALVVLPSDGVWRVTLIERLIFDGSREKDRVWLIERDRERTASDSLLEKERVAVSVFECR